MSEYKATIKWQRTSPDFLKRQVFAGTSLEL